MRLEIIYVSQRQRNEKRGAAAHDYFHFDYPDEYFLSLTSWLFSL